MNILISNDDGYRSLGIAALVEACEGLGEVYVCAPEQNASATSNSLTVTRPLSIFQNEKKWHVVNGTPSDSVHIALTAQMLPRPNLVLSGINFGANLGEDTLYSGTVAAATEGYLFGIPAVAFSLCGQSWENLESAKAVARGIIESLLTDLTPQTPAYLLNVNIPNLSSQELKGSKICRLGRRHATTGAIRAENPRGEPIYWIGPAGKARESSEGTDFHAIRNGYVSVTPLQVDLTDHVSLPVWKDRLGMEF